MSDNHEIMPKWLSEPAWMEFLWKLHPSGHWDSAPGNLEYFEPLLGTSVNKALSQLQAAGFIVDPTPQQRLNTLTLKDLKPILKENGLKVSGRKADVIERIVENVPTDRLPAVEPELFMLSDDAREMALAWRESKKEKKAETIRAVLEHLSANEVEKAVDTVFAYEREQVIPRGMNCDWNSETFKKSQLERCKETLKCPAAALAHLPEEERRKVLVVAATLELIGQHHDKWVGEYFAEIPHLADDKIIRIPSNFAHYRRQIASAKEVGWKVRLHSDVAEQRGCTFCPRLNGLIYDPDEAPELPFPECPIEGPCMAMYTTAHQLESLPPEVVEAPQKPPVMAEERKALPQEVGLQPPDNTKSEEVQNWIKFVGLVLVAVTVLLAILFAQNI